MNNAIHHARPAQIGAADLAEIDAVDGRYLATLINALARTNKRERELARITRAHLDDEGTALLHDITTGEG